MARAKPVHQGFNLALQTPVLLTCIHTTHSRHWQNMKYSTTRYKSMYLKLQALMDIRSTEEKRSIARVQSSSRMDLRTTHNKRSSQVYYVVGRRG
jgi:hypothetical protein